MECNNYPKFNLRTKQAKRSICKERLVELDKSETSILTDNMCLLLGKTQGHKILFPVCVRTCVRVYVCVGVRGCVRVRMHACVKDGSLYVPTRHCENKSVRMEHVTHHCV